MAARGAHAWPFVAVRIAFPDARTAAIPRCLPAALPRSRSSAACGPRLPRAYPRYWRCGRVAEGGGLLNRYRLVKAYRGFESLRLRQPALRDLTTFHRANQRRSNTLVRNACRAKAFLGR